MHGIVNILSPVEVSKAAGYSLDRCGYGESQDIMIYRRAMVPDVVKVSDGVMFDVPLLKMMYGNEYYLSSTEIQTEIMKFFNDCLIHLNIWEYDSVREGLRAAAGYLERHGTHIGHILYGDDLESKKTVFHNYLAERKCFRGLLEKRMVMVLPSPDVAGLLSIDANRFGMTLNQEYVFAFRVR